ncbi:uncharacterized protein [Amphiura filiformis]
MEFAPIPSLSVNTSPGTKIQICGNVQYRHGVLMLSAQNVKVLGGEVDSLVEANNQDAVLAQALGQPSIPMDQQIPNQPTQQNQMVPPSQQQQQHQQPNHQQVVDLTADDHPTTSTSSGISSRQSMQNTRQQAPTPRVVEDDPFIDDFDDDDDFDEAMLQGLEEIELQQEQTRSSNQAQAPAHPTVQQQSNVQRNSTQGRDGNTIYNSTIKTETKVTTNNSIPQEKQSRTFLGQRQNQTNSIPQANQPRPFLGQRQNQNPNGSSFLGNRGNVSNSTSNVQRPNVAVAARIEKEPSPVNRRPGITGHIDSKPTIQAGPSRTSNTGRTFLSASNQGTRNPPVNSIKSELPSSSRQGFVKSEPSRTATHMDTFNQSVNRANVKSEPGLATTSTSNSSRFQSDAKPCTSNRTSGFAPASSVVKPEPGVSGSNQIGTGHPSVRTEPSEFGRSAQRSSAGPGVSGMSTGMSGDDEDESVMAKRRRFYSGQNPGADIDSNLPYSCLSLVLRKQAAKENCVISVKGFIMTLVSSLTCKGGWNVMATINDGTGSMDVDIGNEVLTRLIGFSVLELMQMKKAAARATKERQTDMKQQMQQGLEKCQQALVDMSCIMTLEIRPEYERPRVLTIRDINEGDCLTLIHQL